MSNHFHANIPLLFSRYATPNNWRSAVEVFFSLSLLFIGLTGLYFALQKEIWSLLILILPVSFLFTRLFILQHDLAHGNLFQKEIYNHILGNILGIMVLTPFYLWRKAHMIHHASGGNADKRPWIGDIDILTVNEYNAKGRLAKLAYRIHMNPLVLFLLGSIYVFMVEHRFCKHTYRNNKAFGRKERWSIWGTNIAIILLCVGIVAWLGTKFLLFAILIPLWLGGTIGIYLFYVQHNFKDKYIAPSQKWNLEDSALKGSTFYNLPQPLKWLTANIGYHHVHTLVPRIPFYRLPRCHQENDFFKSAPKFSLKDLPELISLKLYDEANNMMLSWKEYKKLLVIRKPLYGES